VKTHTQGSWSCTRREQRKKTTEGEGAARVELHGWALRTAIENSAERSPSRASTIAGSQAENQQGRAGTWARGAGKRELRERDPSREPAARRPSWG
jgi:hypothetical protein